MNEKPKPSLVEGADFNDLTHADNPYDKDGNLRLTTDKMMHTVNGATGSADLVAETIRTQNLVLPERQMEELIDRVKAHKNKGLPTQVVHPWRTVVRTLIQHVSGLIVAGLIWLLASIGVDVSDMGADLIVSMTVILTLFFSGVAARIMALPKVEDFFAKYITPFATGVSEE